MRGIRAGLMIAAAITAIIQFFLTNDPAWLVISWIAGTELGDDT